ncbi:MAG: phospholipase [bacterium]|nr:phospholipase [bacterium]
MIENKITTTKTARYFVTGSPGNEITEIWFVIHGYGQLAETFLKDFNCLEKENRLIIAPEALSRFYLYGGKGTVGASWMTKVSRLDEINDYINYLDTIYENALNRCNRGKNAGEGGAQNKMPKITLLGFSQGTATAARWAARSNWSFDKLILWGGDFPHDLDLVKYEIKLAMMNIQFVSGKKDPLLKPAVLEIQKRKLAYNNINCSLKFFDGAHEIHQETLMELAPPPRGMG